MKGQPLTLFFWRLPYGMRRVLVRNFQPRHYQRLRQLREPGGELYGPDQQRSIFVHIPKCAGMSVRQGLFGDQSQRGHFAIRHYTLIYPRHEFESYFKFAFARNPWDRLRSAYAYLSTGGTNAHDAAWAEKHLSDIGSFEEFVLRWVTPANIVRSLHFVPQVRFLSLPGRSSLETDFLGFYENLAADFAHVRDCLNVSGALSHANRTETTGTDYRDDYSDDMRTLVAEVYREDIDALGYSFDNSSLSRQLDQRIPATTT